MRRLALVLLAFFAADVAQSGTIRLSPNGQDTNDGSEERPIATLKQAQEIVRRLPPQDITVLIAPGLYRGQSVSWRYTNPAHSIRFIGAGKGQTVFDGERKGRAFFRLHASRGQRSNIHFEGFTITRYVTAISFIGNREDSSKFNSHNSIIGNEFIDVGGIGYDPMGYSTAVVALMNSNDNIVRGNSFRGMIGLRCEHLHAIYVSHNAHRNLIQDNEFEDGCGDPVRIRDASHGTIVDGNRFKNVGVRGAIEEWWCYARRGCLKKGIECPPIGTVVRNNLVTTGFKGVPIVELYRHKRPVDPSCQLSPTTSEAPK